jgi:hypothetical protein
LLPIPLPNPLRLPCFPYSKEINTHHLCVHQCSYWHQLSVQVASRGCSSLPAAVTPSAWACRGTRSCVPPRGGKARRLPRSAQAAQSESPINGSRSRCRSRLLSETVPR